MDTQLKQLETDLKSLKKSAGDGDRFSDVMNISFGLDVIINLVQNSANRLQYGRCHMNTLLGMVYL